MNRVVMTWMLRFIKVTAKGKDFFREGTRLVCWNRGVLRVVEEHEKRHKHTECVFYRSLSQPTHVPIYLSAVAKGG